MAILEKEVWVTINGKNQKYYETLNYEIPKYIDKQGRLIVKLGTKILVKLEDLPKNSNVKITKTCDKCGEKSLNLNYCLLIRSRERSGLDLCNRCSKIESHKRRKENLKHENCLWSTHPEVAKLLKCPENGYNTTHGSHNRQDFICPNCSFEIKNKKVSNVIAYGLSCSKCSDGISYPEKFVFNLLEQLEIEFESQKIFNWSNGKRYDFYIKNNIILETHGSQHYAKGFSELGGRILEEEQENDRLKEKMAKENDIEDYFTIECIRSEYEYIKNKILVSSLSKVFDLGNIDWLKCHEYACGSLVKIASDLWNQGNKVLNICEKMKVKSGTTIRKYLKQGTELGWCEYNPKEIIKNIGKNSSDNKRKPVVRLSLEGNYIDEFKSKANASRELGIYVLGITRTCEGVYESVKGYKFMYKENYEKLINN